MKLPCPKCGNKETIGTFCKTCQRNLHPLVNSVKPAKLILCVSCDREKYQHTWSEHRTRKLVNHILTLSDGAHIHEITWKPPNVEKKPGIKKTTILHATVRGNYDDTPTYDEQYDIPLAYEVTLCPSCKKRGTSYYEGTVQVRNEHPQVRQAIERYMREHAKKGVHLTKHVPIGNGADYYLSSHRAVGHLARKLHKEFGGELKLNAKHFSEDKQAGKILYRTTALLELPEYVKGSVIKRDETYYYVLGIASTVKAENLTTGSEENFAYRRGDTVTLPVMKTQVTSAHPLEVLHPQTFQPVTPTRSKYAPAELDVDASVTVAVDGERVFLIPETGERSVAQKKRRRVSRNR